jgi:ATP-dependent Lhr-like helicase
VAAQNILDSLRTRGASFLKRDEALEELIDAGLVTSDGFAGRHGRWSLLGGPPPISDGIEIQAWALIRRYGVVFRRMLTREPAAAPWRELARVYRRLEARGEIRGGRFVNGMSGEQFALPEAVERLREVRREGNDGRVIAMSACDPLNLAGILDSGERIRAVPTNRIAYRDGVPLSVMEGDYLRPLTQIDSTIAMEVASALAGRRVPVASGFVGR